MIHRLCSRVGLYWGGGALALVAIAVACGGGTNTISTPGDDGGSSGVSSSGVSSSGVSSSGVSSSGVSSSGVSSSGVSSSGVSSSGVSSSGASSSGSGSSSGTTADGGCMSMTMGYVAARLTVPVTWASSLAGNMGAGNVSILLLTTLNQPAGSTMFTGTTQTCSTTLPPLELNAAGDIAVGGVPIGGKGQVQITLPDAMRDKVAMNGVKFAVTGTQSSWNIGGTLVTNPVVGLVGLKPASTYMTAGTAWPAYCANNCTPNGAFTAADLSDDDSDTNPGITAVPVMMTTAMGGFYYPPTAVGLGGSAPVADKVYIVSRNKLSISGTKMDCMSGSGTATVSLFDNHVVGCHVNGAAVCNSAQVSFLDQNRTIYVVGSGATVKVKQLTGAAPTCVDARTALP